MTNTPAVRQTEEAARIAIEAWLDREAPGYPDYSLCEDGETGWAFWIAPHDTTSYLHADMRIEWCGTCWPEQYEYDDEYGKWSTRDEIDVATQSTTQRTDMTPEELEAHRVRFEQRYAADRGWVVKTVSNYRHSTGYGHSYLHQAWQAYQWAVADADLAQRSAPVSEAQPVARVYLVATGEVYEGREQYTRHDSPPPLSEYETLYTAAQPVEVQRAPLTDYEQEAADWIFRLNTPDRYADRVAAFCAWMKRNGIKPTSSEGGA